MRVLWGTMLVLGVALLTANWSAADDSKGDKKVDTRVFELRTYHVMPGKMDALQARFRDHTNKLLEKHGMTLIGFWVPTKAGESEKTLIYVVAHPSEEEGRKNWAAFINDPEWKAAKAESEKNGPLVEKVDSVYMKPTAFSAMK